ncbi:MAG: hypothetical protein K9N21_21520, partial [Deltaproteobacteria bacterium]|nr:hypothetical protein [Deltaproteobacteria bacterium]
FQWISGYWAAENQNDTAYLPEPPESVEVGPNVTAPSPDYTWIPGCWVWSYGRYAWQPGYWAVMRPDRVWVPAHYVWSPRGYIFVGGYWDFAVANRGVLFAPVSFGIGVTVGPGFYFMPSFMIDLRVFSDCLFWSPRYRHYYFGDYYAPRYYQRGIYPWFSPHARRHGYDPIYAHQRWRHRHDRNWEKNLHATYQARRKYEAARPPRTLYDPRKPMVSKASGHTYKAPFVPVTKSREGMSKFTPLSRTERAQFEARGKQVRELGNQRLKLESHGPARPPSGGSKGIAPNRVKLPKSPIAGRPTGPAPTRMAPAGRNNVPHPGPTVGSPQRSRSGTPGTSNRMEMDRRTLPKAPSVSRQAGPAPTRMAPAGRNNASNPNPAIVPQQSRSFGGGERHINARPADRGNRSGFPGR